jgi:hypothetical protein
VVIVDKLVEWRLAGETEVLGENLPQRHFIHRKSHITFTLPSDEGRAATENTLSDSTEYVRLMEELWSIVWLVLGLKLGRGMSILRVLWFYSVSIGMYIEVAHRPSFRIFTDS